VSAGHRKLHIAVNMIKNYFKTAFRRLIRNRVYTFINVAGLAIGIAICMAIFIIIQFHAGFDSFHPNKNRIYRVLTEYHHKDSKNVFYGHAVPFGIPNGMAAAFPQIEKIAPIFSDRDDRVLVLNNNGATVKKFKEEKGIFYTVPSFFNIFNFPLLAGSYASLKDPNNCLLTKQTAIKYFDDWKTAIGKNIRLNDKAVLKVTGILNDPPANTDFEFSIAVAYGTGFTQHLATSSDMDGTNGSFGCFALLAPGTSASNFNLQLREWTKKVKAADNQDSQVIQPFAEVHYDTAVGSFSGKTISHQLINALWLIAGFILLIACVNFVNLSTAQAVNRAREVGVRKVLGSNKLQLKLQFFSETLLIVSSAMLVALIIASLTLPAISKIVDLPLSISLFMNVQGILLLIAVAVIVTLLSSFYPSVVLSGFNAVHALKSKITVKSSRGISLRRSLVVFQFIIAQALIIGTLVIVKQMNYFNHQPLGFNKDAVVNVPFLNDSAGVGKINFLEKQLSAVKGIQQVSFSSNTPIEDDNDNWTTFTFNHAARPTDFYAITKFADAQYVSIYQLPIIAGRNLAPSDTAREFLVTEMLVKNLGLQRPEDVLGKEMEFWDGRFKGTIVGVLKNFNARSFRRELAPLFITTFKKEYSLSSIKLSTTDIPATLASVEKIWNQAFPDYVFEYKFLDDKVAGFYKQESQLAQLYKIFAAMAILLSCLGLYGLASFMAVQRIKEVGIRKVLGASVSNIVYLFSKEFIVLIGIAFLLAAPLAGYYMHQWLHNFPFQVSMSWWIFVAGGAASIVIALITVSSQAISAAMANPVKSLRSE